MLNYKSYNTLLFFLTILVLSGCTHVISPETRKNINKDLLFSTVMQNPEAYKGETVIWGGVITETLIHKDGTIIKVVETPLNYREMPADQKKSRGRFLAKTSKVLDPEIYQKRKKLTLAGEITGNEVHPLGKIQYNYPVILIQESHLWEEKTADEWRGYPALSEDLPF